MKKPTFPPNREIREGDISLGTATRADADAPPSTPEHLAPFVALVAQWRAEAAGMTWEDHDLRETLADELEAVIHASKILPHD